jgi:hypothetical protein
MVNSPSSPFSVNQSSSATALLLVVAPFEENAKRVEARLRNAGHKMRAVWISTLDEVEQHLQRKIGRAHV